MILDIIKNEGDITINGGSLFVGQNAIDNSDDWNRPVLLSELVKRMENRNWGYPIIKTYIDGEWGGYFGPISEDNFPIPTIEKPLFRIHQELPNEEDLEKLYKKMKENTIFYNTSKITIDFLKSTITLDILEKDEYTNTIDLGEIERKYTFPGISCKVDLTIQYTMGGEIYCKDFTFTAFKYNNKGEVDRDNFISDNEDVVIEYMEGVVRVIPEVQNIDECIINNCILTYGSNN